MLKLGTKFAPLPAAFEQAYRAGFRHAELFLNEAILAEGDRAAAVALDYPLTYALHSPNRRDLTDDTLRQLARLHDQLRPLAVIIHQPLFDRYGARLAELAPTMPVAVENHRLTPAEFDAWAERNPGLTLDVEHLWMLTMPGRRVAEVLGGVRRFLQSHAAKLRHVHMPGYLPGQPEHRPMYCSRDFVFGVLSLLDEFHFGGLVVSEVNPEFQNPYDLEMDALLFERWRQQGTPSGWGA